jgi:hypothetical protein
MEDNKIKTYPCAECNKVYETATGLWKHKKNKHTEPEIIIDKNSICKYCNKSFYDRTSRWRHEKNYCKEKFLENLNIKPNVIKHPNKIIHNEHSYIYLIKKYDLNNLEHIYKFGKSTRPIMERLIEHGKEAFILLILAVDNCHLAEEKILNLLKNDKKIKHRKNIGDEYFYCRYDKYIKNLILNNYETNNDDEDEESLSEDDDNTGSLNILSFANNVITD